MIRLHRSMFLATVLLSTAALQPTAAHAEELYLTSGSVTITADSGYTNIYVGRDSQSNTSDPNTNQPYVASATVLEGSFFSSITAYNSNTVSILGGAISNAYSLNSSTVNISGGTLANASGNNTGTVNVSGGTINNARANSNSTLNITGGTIAEVFLSGSSNLNLSGGTIGASTIHQVSDTATVNFFGLNVAYSGATAGSDTGGSGVFYNVAWTRPDSVVVNTRYFDLGGNVANATPQGTTFTFQSAVTVPEASTFALALPALGMIAFCNRIGAVVLRRRKK